MVDIANTKTATPPPPQEDSVDALVMKHNAEIERIRALNTSSPAGIKDQQGEFEKYGIDPEALKEHYKELQAKNDELLERAAVSNRRTTITGFTAFFAAAGAAIWKREKFAPKNPLLQGAFITLFSTAISLIAANIGSFIFNRRSRIESKALVQEAGSVFERELAIAIENKERGTGQKAVSEVAPTPDMGVTGAKPSEGIATSMPRATAPQPRDGFVAEALKEKALAQSAGTQLS